MGGRSILILEERADLKSVLKLSLEMGSPWQVIEASSEREVFELVEVVKIDAIILDTVSSDRKTTIKQLKKNSLTRQIPIVAITQTDRTGERYYWQKLGVAVAIPEMFDPIELVDRIATKLNWPGIEIEINKS